jgi:penicillin-binding protein 1C
MKPIMRYLSRVTLVLLACVMIGSGVIAYWALHEPAPHIPPFDKVRLAYQKSDALLLDRHGVAIHELRTDFEGRKFDWTPLNEISPALIRTVVQSEDKRFYTHGGADPKAFCRAFVRNIFGSEKSGASTITMQLAAILNKSVRPLSVRRSAVQKWKQVRAAWQIERTWSKQQILEAYLNLVNFRGELQGIAAASRGLFHKEPSGLNECESVILAALIRSPNASRERVEKRAQLLASSLQSQTDVAELKNLVSATLAAPYFLKPAISLAPHVALYLLKPGMKQTASTLDADLQGFSQALLRQSITDLKGQNVNDAAVLVLENKTGEVLAYLANTGLNPHAIHVDGIRAKRQAGSTLKPFLYALAIDRRMISAATLLEDAPIDLPTERGIYRPENYDNVYRGQVPARIALASSLNVPAVRLLLLTGAEAFVQKLEALGFGPLRDGDHYGHSLALGTVDVSLWELTNAYRTLANSGWWSEATLQAHAGKSGGRRLFSREAAYIVGDILADREARSETFGLENPLSTNFWTASKTGTSKDMRDNWCIGFSSDYTVGVWVGNFSGEAMWNVSGISGAAPIWLDLMKYLHKAHPSRPPSRPDTVLLIASSGPHPGSGSELFIKGTEPRRAEYVKAWPLPRITYPPAGALIALDPDIPAPHQKIFFQVSGSPDQVKWFLDGSLVGEAVMQPWMPVRGQHRLSLLGADDGTLDTVTFTVRD